MVLGRFVVHLRYLKDILRYFTFAIFQDILRYFEIFLGIKRYFETPGIFCLLVLHNIIEFGIFWDIFFSLWDIMRYCDILTMGYYEILCCPGYFDNGIFCDILTMGYFVSRDIFFSGIL